MTDESRKSFRPSDPDPASPNHAPHLSTTEARSGVTLGHMRWVVTIGIAATLIAFLIVWAITGRG